MRHPNICPIHDAGVEGDTPFIVMSFINGRSLAEFLADKSVKLDQADAAQILQKVAEAVHYAHQNGIVHRDIKPSNILIDVDGNPIVTDFGLAQMSNLPSQFATPGAAMLGTPAYMSPEQAREARDVGPETDIYSLGVVLYEMLSGSVPFNGPVGEVIGAVQYVNPPSAVERNPAVDEGLSNICAKAMKKSPKARYQSAGEFGRALASSVERIRKPKAAESHWRLGSFATIIALILTAVGLPWLLKDRSQKEANPDEANKSLAIKNSEFRDPVEPLGERQTLDVSSADDFVEALKEIADRKAHKERHSFRIALSPGKYEFGRKKPFDGIRDVVGFSSDPTIIESADPNRPAVIADSLLFFDGFEHVVIRNIRFERSNLCILFGADIEIEQLDFDSVWVDPGDYRSAAINIKNTDRLCVRKCQIRNPSGGIGLRSIQSFHVMVLNSVFASYDPVTKSPVNDEAWEDDSIGILLEGATGFGWVDRCVVAGYDRAIQFGGPTLNNRIKELPDATVENYARTEFFEATHCQASHCVIAGSKAAFVFTSCKECEFLNNLAVDCRKYQIRVLAGGRDFSAPDWRQLDAPLFENKEMRGPQNSVIRKNVFLLKPEKFVAINSEHNEIAIGSNYWNVESIDPGKRERARLSKNQVFRPDSPRASEILDQLNPATPPRTTELGEWMLDSEFEQFGIQRTSQVPEFLLDDPKFRKAVEKAQSRRPLKRPVKLREVPQSSGE